MLGFATLAFHRYSAAAASCVGGGWHVTAVRRAGLVELLRHLSRSPGRGRVVSRLLQRLADHADRVDAQHVAARGGRHAGRHRSLRLRVRALHVQVRLGAVDGPAALAALHDAARTAARLDAGEPDRSHRLDLCVGSDGTGCRSLVDRLLRRAGRLLLGEPGYRHRRLQGRDPAGGQARCRRRGHRARLSNRHVGGDGRCASAG